MYKNRQPTKKTVTIVYGTNEVKKKRVLERLFENKKIHNLKQQDINDQDQLIVPNNGAKAFSINCTDIVSIEPLIADNAEGPGFKPHIFLKDATGKLTEVAGPELVIEIQSLSEDDLLYFSRMEHVNVISCIKN